MLIIDKQGPDVVIRQPVLCAPARETIRRQAPETISAAANPEIPHGVAEQRRDGTCYRRTHNLLELRRGLTCRSIPGQELNYMSCGADPDPLLHVSIYGNRKIRRSQLQRISLGHAIM